jgi:hypothetical protein
MISEPTQCLHLPNIIFYSSIRKKVFLSQFDMISPNIWNTKINFNYGLFRGVLVSNSKILHLVGT